MSESPASPPRPRVSTRTFFLVGGALCLLLACVVSVWASSQPDGLEYVAHTAGFIDTARDSASAVSPLAGYQVAGVADPWLSTAIVGVAGCVLTFAVAAGIGLVARRRRRTTDR